MLHRRLLQIIRQFRENGLKLLLEHPANVNELLHMAGAEGLDLIDWDRLTLDRTTYVQRDYRHVESDVVLQAPVRGRGRTRSRRRILIYILIEHQSEPDRLIVLRVLDYVVQIYKAQARSQARSPRAAEPVRLHPVLPVVFYTGKRSWERLHGLADLVPEALQEAFGARLPVLDPLFINLGAIPPAQLESAGGFLGWVLRLVQARDARPQEFRSLLRHVVQHLESLPRRDRFRWLELLSYIHALVYHVRSEEEHEDLQDAIADSVQAVPEKAEVVAMRRTIAEALEDKGRKAGRKEGRKEGREEGALRHAQATLLRQLRTRFPGLPPQLVQIIEQTHDLKRLDAWLERVVTATTPEQVGIAGPA